MPIEPKSTSQTSAYWSRIGHEWVEKNLDAFWRTYCDNRNSALCLRWLSGKKIHRVLKTDLFDEAVTEGLYPILQRHASQVIGIDISRVISHIAHVRFPMLESIETDIRHLPFTDSTFDAITSFSSLDHFDSLQDLKRGLQELHRVLKPQGLLVITLDNLSNPIIALRNRLPFVLLHRLGIVPYQVGKTCGGKQLTGFLASVGFQIRELTYVEHCPRILAVKVGRLIAGLKSDLTKKRYLRVLRFCEHLENWPTRALTGHYVAALAIKP